MKGRFDAQETIDKMVEVIGGDDGLYSNVWPPSSEMLINRGVRRTVRARPFAACPQVRKRSCCRRENTLFCMFH